MDSGSSESPASLKRVASPAAKAAMSGEGESWQPLSLALNTKLCFLPTSAIRLGSSGGAKIQMQIRLPLE